MPKKSKTLYQCSGCGHKTFKWVGKCNQCKEWNTVEQSKVNLSHRNGIDSLTHGSAMEPLIELNDVSTDRMEYIATGIKEFDRVMGGGFVVGSTTLLAGDPGIGKSTLLLQAVAGIAKAGQKVLYATGEEGLEQIHLRASRLGISGDRIFVVATGNVVEIAAHMVQAEPVVVIVDSIQTATHPDLDSSSGTISQIRECASFLSSHARANHVSLVVSGHVTKDGSIAGPRVLEHQVDTVLQIRGDTSGPLRMLQGVKNRFGPTDELGVFEMREEGLYGVSDPSQVFMSQRVKEASGSAIAIIVEGTRSLAVEIQALVTASSLSAPRRVANGVDLSRLHLIVAVLAKHMKLPLANHDLLINVIGGFEIKEPAADLAIALAIVSSMMDRPVISSVAAAGEIGLAGELRSIPGADRRIFEAARLGFEDCLIPSAVGDTGSDNTVKVSRLSNVLEAVRFALQASSIRVKPEIKVEIPPI